MLLYYPFWMFMGFILHIYIIFGTNLLTGGLVLVFVFLPISVFCRKGIPNGMKPSRWPFLEQTQSRRLGVEVWNTARRSRGRRARPGGRRAPHPHGPHGAPPTYFFRLYILKYPKTFQGSYETTFPPPQPSIPMRSHLEPFPAICQRGIRSWRASTSTP